MVAAQDGDAVNVHPSAAASALLVLDLPAQPDAPRIARHALLSLVRALGAESHAVEVSISEAVTNAVLHAYGDDQPGRIRVSASVDDEALHVKVEDDGTGLKPRGDSPGIGLGLPSMATLADALDIDSRPDGTTVHMRFRVPDRAP